MRTCKGIYYWPEFPDTRAVSASIPGSRVVGYEVGYAVQLRLSGPYVGRPEIGSERAQREGEYEERDRVLVR